MKVAVTGATGFIGRYVVAELDRRAVTPTILARASSILPPALSGHATVNLDVRTPPKDAWAMIGRPDTLIHLAWDGLPNYKSPHHIEEELPAHYSFLDGLVEAGLQNLVVAGTCAEYGLQSGCLSEDRDTEPVHAYGLAKDMLRRQLQQLQLKHKFALTWARLFYVYGDGQSQTSLFPQLRSAVFRGEKTFPMSSGEQLRDFLPVATAAELIVALALSWRSHGVVNICSGRPVSVRSAVEGWIEENGWTIELGLGELPSLDYESAAFWGDRGKLDRCLASR